LTLSYIISRGILAVAMAGVFAATGTPLWLSAVIGILVFLLFLWLPRSGRYVVRPELGATALRRDERTQQITDKAARNAFVVLGLVVAGGSIYFGAAEPSQVPVGFLTTALTVGALTYFLSDLIMRRS
jgi:hypothetical protein